MSWPAPFAAAALSFVVVGHLRITRPALEADGYMIRLRMAAIVLAAAASVALDDPAASLLVSSPTVRRGRSLARVALVVMWWTLAWIPTIVVVALANGSLDVYEIGAQSVALLAIALAVAALAGQVAGAVAVFIAALVAAIVPSTWSVLEGDAGDRVRLLILTGGALALLAWGTRDPAATS